MNYKKLLGVAGIALVVLVFTAFVVAPNLGTNQPPSFNVVEIYISAWDMNNTESIDVKFKISIDFNGDGVFEFEKLSSKFNDTYVEVAPFKLGGPIASTISTFTFKVEVFKVASNEALEQMYYTPDGVTPVNNGTNHVDASKSWSWDATGIEGANEYACKVSYWYFINFVA